MRQHPVTYVPEPAYYWSWEYSAPKSAEGDTCRLSLQTADDRWTTLLSFTPSACGAADDSLRLAQAMFDHAKGEPVDPELVLQWFARPGRGLRFTAVEVLEVLRAGVQGALL